MKLRGNLPGFDISAKGLSIQRKRMNLIAENIANAESTRTENGKPYTRKFLNVIQEQQALQLQRNDVEGRLKMSQSSSGHMRTPDLINANSSSANEGVKMEIMQDAKEGELIFMPNHPDADPNGYVQMSNVNVVEEMVEMIAATRSYEANLTAFNASKEMAKNSLEI